jgi:hypothetical protein
LISHRAILILRQAQDEEGCVALFLNFLVLSLSKGEDSSIHTGRDNGEKPMTDRKPIRSVLRMRKELSSPTFPSSS